MTAVARTQRIQPGSNVRWIDIERAAFHAHRAVFDAKPAARRAIRPWEHVASAVVAIIMACFWLAPIAGYVIVTDSRRFGPATPDYERMIPISGGFYLCAVVYLVVAAILWACGGRKPNGLVATNAFMTGILGTLAAISLARHGAEEGVANWEQWTTAVASAAIVGFIVGTMVQAGSRRRVKEGPEADRRRAGIEGLTPEERDAIRADLADAIDDLEQRGLIDTATAEAARTAELGFLAGSVRAAMRSR